MLQRTPDTPIDVQVAVQGGGAKLIALLAALEAFRDYEERGAIRIVRLAGTSAGAIAAALYSRGKTVVRVPEEAAEVRRIRQLTELKRKLEQTRDALFGARGAALRRDFRIAGGWLAKIAAFRRAARGRAIWQSHALEQWLREEFGDRRFEDLDTPVEVVSTSLGRSEKVLHAPGDDVVDSLLASAGIPFFLRNWTPTGEVSVDGGLCENLPVGELTKDIPVVAISFQRSRSGAPRNLVDFAKGLLNVAIDNSVDRVRKSLEAEHVYEIKTSVGTFDFERAFDPSFDDQYQRIRGEADAFLGRFVEHRRGLMRASRNRYLNPLFWTDPNPRLRAALECVGAVYESQHAPTRIQVHSCRFEVVAHTLRDTNTPSRVIAELEFSAIDRPVYCTATVFSAMDPTGLLASTTFKVHDQNGNPVDVLYAPMIEPGGPARRCVVLYYVPPLQPRAGTYRERTTDESSLVLADFKDLSYPLPKAKGPIGRFELVLHVPNELPGLKLVPKAGAGNDPHTSSGAEMPADRVRALRMNRDELEDFYTLGWYCVGVEFPPTEAFGANITGPLTR